MYKYDFSQFVEYKPYADSFFDVVEVMKDKCREILMDIDRRQPPANLLSIEEKFYLAISAGCKIINTSYSYNNLSKNYNVFYTVEPCSIVDDPKGEGYIIVVNSEPHGEND